MPCRGCSIGVVLLRWFGVVSWHCCGIVSCSVVESAVFFFRNTFLVARDTFEKSAIKYP